VGQRLTLIGVGGISTVDEARARLDAGATLLQGYTAFVYEGPLWPRRILRGLAEATP
jgi:dihydroorotate dehydrogenase